MMEGEFSMRDSANMVEVVDALRGALNAVLPTKDRINDDQAWDSFGLDSLQTLHVALGVERALGVKVPFDLFEPEQTFGELCNKLHALADHYDEPEGFAEGALPIKMFLVPGVGGDEPILASFRRATREIANFKLLELPGIHQHTRTHKSLSQTVEYLLDQLRAEHPAGPIHLTGYSLGAIVAYEVACALEAQGRHIALLCLIDPIVSEIPIRRRVRDRTKRQKISGRAAIKHDNRRLPEKLADHVERWMFRVFARLRWMELARRVIVANRNRYTVELLHIREKHVLEELRRRLISSWSPRVCSAPIFLVTSDDYFSYNKVTRLGLSPTASNVHVSCRHYEVFEPEALAIIVPAYKRAVLRTSMIRKTLVTRTIL